ncbi:hypothetical protein QFZ75_007985 [Streptomyces sp. V3I8]|uniref:hypothetical protein n=1 Tax=Streptomyces sp. V3I8 TaxID=3042279 RepID=UPI0027898DB5|nr:hypothetical protein [Streptomyces sp. V3I8]MDQ1041483.1 hypothetical protein [Streptomyces sp. V3I8]
MSARPPGSFPAPPATSPAAALHDQAVGALQKLHNHLATTRPRTLAEAADGESAVEVAIRLLGRLPAE